MAGTGIVQQDGELVIIMGSIHRVLKAETLLKKADLPVEVVVTPRELSSDCGMVVTCPADYRDAVLSRLRGSSLEWEKIFLRRDGAFEEL